MSCTDDSCDLQLIQPKGGNLGQVLGTHLGVLHLHDLLAQDRIYPLVVHLQHKIVQLAGLEGRRLEWDQRRLAEA